MVYRHSLLLALSFALLACSSSGSTGDVKHPVSDASFDSTAYLAGGCFWGVEHFLEELPGVASVESGYSGGHVDSPSYEDVVAKGTGHLEVVRVRFDSSAVSFHDIAKRFFEIHDPTQVDGQGPDIGQQYKSAIFYTSEEQKKTSEALIARLEERGFDVATELRSFEKFWLAEDYHQNYYVKKKAKPYCHMPVNRFGD